MFAAAMRRAIGRGRRPAPARWPDKADGPVAFSTILVFTPPNSGSTAISGYLQEAECISAYQAARAEMQWLVPGLCEPDRWWPDKPVSYRSVAGTLRRTAQERLRCNPQIEHFVEKSPPNMVRHRQIVDLFEAPRIVVNNREPYANIASQIRRYGDTLYRGLDRDDMVAHLATMWLRRSMFLTDIAETYGAPVLTYEAFCAHPPRIAAELGLDVPGLRADAVVRVKDYDAQGISNMNARQEATLTTRDMETITRVLSGQRTLLEEFSYHLR